MENLYISDLFGYNITNGSPIVVINVNNTKNIFIKIANDTDAKNTIFKYNMQLINSLLLKRNVDPNNFLIIGHILLENNSNKFPEIIVLANKNICLSPNGFEEIGDFSNGKIIRFYNKSEKNKITYSVGLFYFTSSDTIEKEMQFVGIIPDKFLIPYQNSNKKIIDQDSLTSNDFGLLSLPSLGIKTLSRTHEIQEKFKLLNKLNDKYLTVMNNETFIKQGLSNISQLFSYNAQGELINENDGKCLSYNDSEISPQTCDPQKLNQKWIVTQNKILPSNNFGKCLDVSSLDKTSVQLNDCDSSDSQIWTTETENNSFDNSESVKSGDYVWSKYKGKTLALVENDNPWFVNTDIVDTATIDESVYRMNDVSFREAPHYQTNYLINLKNNNLYQSDFIIDPKSPSLGYGYSFKSRGGKPCQKNDNNSEQIENFNNFDNTELNDKQFSLEQQIFIIVTLIVILLILYRIFKHFN